MTGWTSGARTSPCPPGRRLPGVVPAALVVLLVACTSPVPSAEEGTDAGQPRSATAPAEVAPPAPTGGQVEVIDGDTFRATIEGEEVRVRLIGVDAPEHGECMAERARARLADLLASGITAVEHDVTQVDQYGRQLLYVTTSEGMVNAILVREGLAIARRYPPNDRYAELFDSAEQEARSGRRGLWAHEACGEAAVAEGLVIAHVEADAPGDDGENLNGEWVELANRGAEPIDLSGWRIRDESASHRFDFPAGFTLDPGAAVRIYSGCGRDTETELFWCTSGSAIWNNSGDTVFLQDPAGNIVMSTSY